MKKFLSVVIRKAFYSFNGFWIVLKEEKSIWTYLFFAVILVGLGFWIKLSFTKWAIIIAMLFISISTEVINTALEAAVDAISFQYNIKVKKIKDIAAGATLVMTVGLIIVALIIYIPGIMEAVHG